jgi:hypothetical protein
MHRAVAAAQSLGFQVIFVQGGCAIGVLANSRVIMVSADASERKTTQRIRAGIRAGLAERLYLMLN